MVQTMSHNKSVKRKERESEKGEREKVKEREKEKERERDSGIRTPWILDRQSVRLKQ